MKRHLQNASLVLVSIVVGLCFAEFYLRITDFDPNLSPIWQHHPDLGWTIQRDRLKNVSEHGFRHAPLTARKPPGTKRKRLLILGDSFAQATALDYDSTFPGYLETHLNTTSSEHWEVLKFGVGDWGTAQQLLSLKHYGLAYEPDVIVLQVFPLNDICNNNIRVARTCSLQDHHRPYLVATDAGLRTVYIHPWRRTLRNASRLFALLEGLIMPGASLHPGLGQHDLQTVKRLRNELYSEHGRKVGLTHRSVVYVYLDDAEQPAVFRHGWAVTRAMFEEVTALAAERNIELVALVIPYKGSLDPSWSPLPVPVDTTRGTRRVEQMLSALAIPVISVRKQIGESGLEPQDFFLADSHFSATGHFHTARWIMETLNRSGSSRVEPPHSP